MELIPLCRDMIRTLFVLGAIDDGHGRTMQHPEPTQSLQATRFISKQAPGNCSSRQCSGKPRLSGATGSWSKLYL